MSVVNPHLSVRNVVNLNDWRVQARSHLRRQFFLLLGIGLIAVSVAAGMVWLLVSGWQSESDLERSAMQSQIASLSPKVTEHAAVKADLAVWQAVPALLARANHSRGRIRDLLLDISVQIPSGVVIESIRFDGELIDVKGSAPSKSAAVDFVRGLKTRGWPAAVPSVSPGNGNSRSFQFLIKPKARKSK